MDCRDSGTGCSAGCMGLELVPGFTMGAVLASGLHGISRFHFGWIVIGWTSGGEDAGRLDPCGYGDLPRAAGGSFVLASA